MKSSFTTCFIRLKVLPSEDSILDYDIKSLIHFHESLIRILNSKLHSSKEKTPRIVFQNSGEMKRGFEELSMLTGLFFLLQNIFKSREFDVVQTVRLLQCDLCGFFSRFVSVNCNLFGFMIKVYQLQDLVCLKNGILSKILNFK